VVEGIRDTRDSIHPGKPPWMDTPFCGAATKEAHHARSGDPKEAEQGPLLSADSRAAARIANGMVRRGQSEFAGAERLWNSPPGIWN
jgi:hypothetical protein